MRIELFLQVFVLKKKKVNLMVALEECNGFIKVIRIRSFRELEYLKHFFNAEFYGNPLSRCGDTIPKVFDPINR